MDADRALVLRLRRGRETYLRHIEFERSYRPGLERSLFERASALTVRFRLPVRTTVFFIRPPAPRALSYRETISGRLVHQRRFGVVRLWQQKPETLLRQGAGPAALVGLADGCRPEHVRRAARLIAASSRGPVREQILGILRALCSERFTGRELAELIPDPAPRGTRTQTRGKRPARTHP
jgi:hypothetical protein